MNEKLVFWEEVPPREIYIMFSPALYDGTIAKLAKVSVYPSPSEGFLINDYNNRIGKRINEKIRVKYGETVGTIGVWKTRRNKRVGS